MMTPREWIELHARRHGEGLRYAEGLLRAHNVPAPAETAKDVCQEAWTAAWRFAQDSAEHARALFFYVIRVQVSKIAHRLDVASRGATDAAPPSTVRLGWGAVADARMLHAVEVMTCDSFDVWYLADVRGLTREAAAEALGVPKNVANGRLARARSALKND